MIRWTIQSATLQEPLLYRMADGAAGAIPAGPCLLESRPRGHSLVIWGNEGQFSTEISNDDINRALATRQLELTK